MLSFVNPYISPLKRGREKKKVLPLPGVLSTRMDPP